MPDNENIEDLEKNIGLVFLNKEFLKQALVHRSYLNENPKFKLAHNERLEFLGDAVLELVVTKHLFENYPNPEGELTNWRSALVNSKKLAEISEKLKFHDFLYLSRGEAKDNGRAREYILGNTYEAVTGAIYLDQGYEVASDFIHRTLIKELPDILKNKSFIDPKSHLQEKLQEKFKVTPEYKVLDETGPDHDRQFKVGVYLEKKLLGTGEGPSKQQGQTNAAKDALDKRIWDK